jgi:hypothetical protein
MRAAPGVKSATLPAAQIHRARKPAGNDGTRPQNPDQDCEVEEQVFQPLYVSRKLSRYLMPRAYTCWNASSPAAPGMA